MRLRRISIAFALAWAFIGSSHAFAGAVRLNLLGAGPTGTVYLTSSSLPAGYQTNTDVYAGVLDWTDNSKSNAPDYWTYCVDIASVIGISPLYDNPPQYQFNSESFGSLASALSGTFTTPVINGIENLWNQNESGFENTLGGTSTNNSEATELQIALWDIIYNGQTGTLYDGSSPTYNSGKNTTPLYFDNASPGVLGTALGLATTAYNVGSAPSSTPGLMALEATDGGQNQIYLSAFTLTTTGVTLPLPNLAGSFLVMLGIVALLKASKLDVRFFMGMANGGKHARRKL